MVENINILNRIARGPKTKENPLGKLYSVYEKRSYWMLIRVLNPTETEQRFDHIPEPDFRRTFELMHPEERTKKEIIYGDIYYAKENLIHD